MSAKSLNARRVGVTTETMTVTTFIQMVSIFGFGLVALVARCSANPENLVPQPMLMAMIALTRRCGRVTFATVVPSKKQGRPGPPPRRSPPGGARTCAGACLSASAEANRTQVFRPRRSCVCWHGAEAGSEELRSDWHTPGRSSGGTENIDRRGRACSRDGCTPVRSSPPGRRNKRASRQTCTATGRAARLVPHPSSPRRPNAPGISGAAGSP